MLIIPLKHIDSVENMKLFSEIRIIRTIEEDQRFKIRVYMRRLIYR